VQPASGVKFHHRKEVEIGLDAALAFLQLSTQRPLASSRA
jgi:hypothetical protein